MPSRSTIRRSSALFCLAAVLITALPASADGPTPVLPSPLSVAPAQRADGATALTLNPQVYDTLRDAQRVVLRGFPLDADRALDLDLQRIEVFAPDAILLVVTPEGERPLDRPDVLLLAGHVVGQPDASAFLALTPNGVNGFLRLPDETFILSSGPHAAGRNPVIYETNALPAGAIALHDLTCGNARLPMPAALQARLPAPQGAHAADSHGMLPCRVADIALETDYAFTGTLFGGDTGASSAYAATLMAAISEIYRDDINTEMRIAFLRVWATNTAPWNQSGAFDQFFQFRDYWNANMTHVQRHAVHFLSGRQLSGAGGLAYLGALCYPEYDYGLSAYLNGFFPYPLQNNHGQNWDLMVVAHELGHNFGAPHSHDLDPPIDRCAFGDCSITPNGTIMSYCHTCPGGMTNIRLELHERMIAERILPFLESNPLCDLTTLTVETFVAVLLDPDPGPNQRCLADMNNDGLINGDDVQPFVQWLLSP
jgi:hypothetical protein